MSDAVPHWRPGDPLEYCRTTCMLLFWAEVDGGLGKMLPKTSIKFSPTPSNLFVFPSK